MNPTTPAQPDLVRRGRPFAHRRGARGIVLLAAIGFLAILGLVVAVSMHMLEAESEIQAQQQKERIAFYAAEAGLAEARAMIRAMWSPADGFARVFAELTDESTEAQALRNPTREDDPFNMGGACDEPGTAGVPVIPCLYQLIPRQNYFLRVNANHGFDGLDPESEAFYPEQDNVTFETFIYDDADRDNTFTQDANRQFWVVSVGEVAGRPGERPARVTLRALVTGPRPLQSDGSYSSQKGGGASKLGSF